MPDRVTYPSLPARTWWDLRRRFQQSPPSKVDSDYLQTVLSIQEKHAANLTGPLTQLGLIDDNGQPTPVAEDWRHDETYPEACKKILENVYPPALREALPPPKPDRGELEKWFARNARVGTAAAGKMATTYLVIAAADPSGSVQQQPQRSRDSGNGAKRRAARKPEPARRPAAPATTEAAASEAVSATGTAAAAPNGAIEGPSVHVDVQVHISPDATADQIDAIFASMAKHLYAKRP
jgi:hypothetical protein